MFVVKITTNRYLVFKHFFNKGIIMNKTFKPYDYLKQVLEKQLKHNTNPRTLATANSNRNSLS